ncbi:MAG: transketolase, partial [Candidatus Tectomicrobia bacterium]|nr:transketolase [Candidatus Tectomicrobia bacterium]
ILLYSMLHLTGYDLSLDELKKFRQWGSKTPGHPEFAHTPGVETTTGPLGQGFGNGVGMALAQEILASRFNQPDYPILDHTVYGIVSDGDLMEGVASEAASLAGHLGLGKLVYFYDDNRITIEGSTRLAFTEDVARRFEAYGWHVQKVSDGNDLKAIEEAVEAARAEAAKPSLILLTTHIAYGSPNKQDSADAHGSPLGAEEVKLTKQNLGWPVEPAFLVPEEALAVFRRCVERGEKLEAQWKSGLANYAREHSDLADEWARIQNGNLPEGWEKSLPVFTPEQGAMATRQASGKVINALAPVISTLIGGSADLAPSTETLIKGGGDVSARNFGARNLRFGVREHGMGAILNGMALYGGLIPYGGTFLIFSDYMRPSIRLAAMMGLRVIYVFTHDSIGLGEDGPTHQPVEHLAALRAIPNLNVIRPADAGEVPAAWKEALTRKSGPTALILTRQKLPVVDRTRFGTAEKLSRGAYVLAKEKSPEPELILIATGSEVSVALEAWEALSQEGITVRLVNVPCWELFEKQPESYREEVLPQAVKARLVVEAASPLGWERYAGDQGGILGVDRFGASAPYEVLMKEYGFTAANVIRRAKALLGR